MELPRIYAPTRRRVFKYRRQSFFAERGLLHVLDEDSGDYKVVSRQEFILRMRSFQAVARREQYADERLELVRMVEDMITCARQAKQQGDPHSRRAVGEMMRQRASTKIAIPGVPWQRQDERPALLGPDGRSAGDTGWERTDTGRQVYVGR